MRPSCGCVATGGPDGRPVEDEQAAAPKVPPSTAPPSYEHLFDTGRVARPVLNGDKPPNIPQRPMGSIPVVIRLVRPDGEEWWPGIANRWTDTHVLVHWIEDEQQAQVFFPFRKRRTYASTECAPTARRRRRVGAAGRLRTRAPRLEHGGAGKAPHRCGMPDQPISHLEDRERQPATADHLRRGAGVRSGFDLSLDELSIPPEIAASDTLRQLVAQFGRMTEELEIRNLQLRELLREMNHIVAQFPEAGPTNGRGASAIDRRR